MVSPQKTYTHVEMTQSVELVVSYMTSHNLSYEYFMYCNIFQRSIQRVQINGRMKQPSISYFGEIKKNVVTTTRILLLILLVYYCTILNSTTSNVMDYGRYTLYVKCNPDF